MKDLVNEIGKNSVRFMVFTETIRQPWSYLTQIYEISRSSSTSCIKHFIYKS